MCIKIDKEAEIAYVDVGSMNSISELKTAVKALLDHPDHVDGMETIFDFRQADLIAVSQQDLNDYARWLAPHVPRLAKRVVIVVKRDLEFGIVRMWNIYSEEIAVQERMILRDMDEARQWLLSGRSK